MNSDKPTGPALQRSEWTGDESVCLAVLRTVAAVSNKTPTDLPPLYEAVDPDALEELMRSDSGQTIEATFPYFGYVITVRSDGEISVSSPDEWE